MENEPTSEERRKKLGQAKYKLLKEGMPHLESYWVSLPPRENLRPLKAAGGERVDDGSLDEGGRRRASDGAVQGGQHGDRPTGRDGPLGPGKD